MKYSTGQTRKIHAFLLPPEILRKYAQKTLRTKTPQPSKKRRNATQIPTGFGNPVIIRSRKGEYSSRFLFTDIYRVPGE